uniref:Uncharacterized protein n=1 Tax=Tetranychus urticae TaxID=32264 RepID=T1KC75_TETUR
MYHAQILALDRGEKSGPIQAQAQVQRQQSCHYKDKTIRITNLTINTGK